MTQRNDKKELKNSDHLLTSNNSHVQLYDKAHHDSVNCLKCRLMNSGPNNKIGYNDQYPVDGIDSKQAQNYSSFRTRIHHFGSNIPFKPIHHNKNRKGDENNIRTEEEDTINTDKANKIGNAFKHFTGQTALMNPVSSFFHLGIFILTLTLAYILIMFFVPMIASIDRGLLFGFGGLVQDTFITILFAILLLLGICIVFCGFVVFYSFFEINGFTAVFFKNIAILLFLGLLLTFFSSNSKQTDESTLQIMFIYFYLLITLSAIIAFLGIVNALPKIFTELIPSYSNSKTLTQDFLIFVIAFFIMLGPVFFSSGVIMTTTLTEGFVVNSIADDSVYKLSVSPLAMKNDFVLNNFIITSLRQNTSTSIFFTLTHQTNVNSKHVVLNNKYLDSISGVVTFTSQNFNSSIGPTFLPIIIHPTAFSNSSWFLTTSFTIPGFNGTKILLDITVPFETQAGSVSYSSITHFIVTFTTYRHTDFESGYYYQKDATRLFGSYTLKTTNFFINVLGLLGILLTFSTLIEQFHYIQDYLAFNFLKSKNRHIILLQPLLPLIISLSLLAVVFNSFYLDPLKKLLVYS